MNWLGRREPELYGTTTSSELDARPRDYASTRRFEIEIPYTNHEGEAIERLYAAATAGNIDAVGTRFAQSGMSASTQQLER